MIKRPSLMMSIVWGSVAIFYFAVAYGVFLLFYGTDYNAQGSTSYWPMLRDFGVALFWPVWLVWLMAVWIYYSFTNTL